MIFVHYNIHINYTHAYDPQIFTGKVRPIDGVLKSQNFHFLHDHDP